MVVIDKDVPDETGHVLVNYLNTETWKILRKRYSQRDSMTLLGIRRRCRNLRRKCRGRTGTRRSRTEGLASTAPPRSSGQQSLAQRRLG
ncbi:hypothetical protein LY76DRAFT_344118 [Colletotrichum caudatum]|nr:hypothetical protein LY76DRAFT_344118 [Colletotrichum caudatum]